MTELSEAVSALVDIRPVVTDQEPGEAHQGGIHVESLPSLLELLVNGAGSMTHGPGSSDPGLPIDADALEIWGQVSGRVNEWCRNAHTPFKRDDLAGSLLTWQKRFDELNVSEEVYGEHVRQVDTWSSWIEAKFDPDTKAEWRDPCPECDVRRMTVDTPTGVTEQFAIEVNVTKESAECRNCGAKWYGRQGLMELRFLSNTKAGDVSAEALKLLVGRRDVN